MQRYIAQTGQILLKVKHWIFSKKHVSSKESAGETGRKGRGNGDFG